MAAIGGFAVYLPWRRLSRSAVVDAHRWINPALAAHGRGTRTMASWDEDSITLAVEAARLALHGQERASINDVIFASTTPPFADRQNAGIVAGALQLREDISSSDVGGSQRAATTALMRALDAVAAGPARNVLVTAADRRKAPAAGLQELQRGDAGAAVVVCADGPVRYLGGGSMTTDFVDHYRETGRDYDYPWEERWVRDEGLKKIVPAAITRTLGRLAIAPASIDHFALPCVLKGADAEVASLAGISRDKVRSNLSDSVGDTGVPHAVLLLVHILEQAKPGERIVLATFGQGCDVLVFETASSLAAYRPAAPLAAQLTRGRQETNYLRYLVFNDLIDWDKGKRAERDKQTALTTLYRKRDVLAALTGGQCRRCGTRQFPSARICVNPSCRAVDTQEPHSFADEPANIVSWSGDHLVFTPDPPLHYGMIAFSEGGRFLAEFADCEPAEITTGAPVRMAFRVKDFDSLRGFRRYFWKAVPDRSHRPAADQRGS